MKKPLEKKRNQAQVVVPGKPIDRAIMDYQVLGKSDNLIDLFRSFLNDYVRLLFYRNVDYQNKQIRYFISYFIGDKELRKQLRGNIFVSRACVDEVKRVIEVLHRNFHYEYEDEVLNELVIILLKMAKDYEEHATGFHGFVYTYYSRYLKSHLMQEDNRHSRNDLLLFAQRYQWFEDEQQLYIHTNIFEDEYFSTENESDDLQLLQLINGEYTPVFEQLTQIQRRILVLYYMDKKTDTEIGKELAMHPGSVQRSRRKMYKTLWEKLKKGEIKCSRLNRQMISLESFLNPNNSVTS